MTSDKYLTEHCSLLSNLVLGDTVLADTGFDRSDSVGLYCSTLKSPAFTRGKSQLPGIKVELVYRARPFLALVWYKCQEGSSSID